MMKFTTTLFPFIVVIILLTYSGISESLSQWRQSRTEFVQPIYYKANSDSTVCTWYLQPQQRAIIALEHESIHLSYSDSLNGIVLTLKAKK